jgi:uncharacterized protein (TIGR02646 family)
MRPVNKGADQGEFIPYGDAQKPLTDQIGDYCSYCERWVCSGIHIEHKKPKDKYPNDEFAWENFLLACVNCNSSKGSDDLELTDYVWPDRDNTSRAFQYLKEGIIIPVTGFSQDIDLMIKNTWELVGLNKHPNTFSYDGIIKPTIKDKRWIHRRDEWLNASRKKESLAKYDTPERQEDMVDIALQRGMFSIWYGVFHDHLDMKRRLVTAFLGTELTCFDQSYDAIERIGGFI